MVETQVQYRVVGEQGRGGLIGSWLLWSPVRTGELVTLVGIDRLYRTDTIG